MRKIWKEALKYAGIILFFLAVAYGFVPQVLDGKIVNQSDISGYVGMAHEANSWNAEHPDDRTAWTNSMFGGMPTTMLTGNPSGDWTQKIYKAFLFGKRPASYIFISLLGAFLLMLSLGINWLVAVAGAIAVTFCSYNFQIIQVGHNTKMMAIAWLPWVLAAMTFTYRKALNLYKSDTCDNPGWRSWLPLTVLGAALFGMTVNFQIKADHIQISYYLAIIIFCYVVGLFIWLMIDGVRRKATGRFFAASFLLLFLGLAGIGTNANKLIPTYLYSQHTMRGGSELAAGNQDDGQKKSKGLDLDYATAWSYGWQELPNMMIPDFNGGSSAGAVNPSKSHTVSLLKQYGQSNANAVAKSLPLYWGPQPFTAGPMYMGAITIFLFLLGLFLCKGRDKWWLLAATLIAVFLGVGRNFMPFTEFWYYHMPFYSKFRTVSMALIILQFTLPMLGFHVLDKILKGEYAGDRLLKPAVAALMLTAGFCLLCAIFPGIAGSFEGSSDSGMHRELAAALQEDRRMLLSHDALISAFMVLGTFLLVFWAYARPKETSGNERFVGSRRMYAAGGICLLVLINMWAVGKRYLNAGHFVKPREFNGQFAQRPVDKAILEDPELGYRTLDLSVNVFNDSHPSYWHRNIGGYSPVKMQRYQDLIDRHLNGEISTLIGAVNKAGTMTGLMESFPHLPVLAMLNDKYIILDGNSAPVVNPDAMGNAWFVDGCRVAETPDEEITLLGEVDLGTTAVLGPDFREAEGKFPVRDKATEMDKDVALDNIHMTSYAPNELRYHYTAASDRAVVFSEIYYPSGWTAWIVPSGPQDRSSAERWEIELFRADWTLRAAVLPAGEHDLVMRFEPQSYVLSSNVSRGSSALLLLLVLVSASAALFFDNKKRSSR